MCDKVSMELVQATWQVLTRIIPLNISQETRHTPFFHAVACPGDKIGQAATQTELAKELSVCYEHFSLVSEIEIETIYLIYSETTLL